MNLCEPWMRVGRPHWLLPLNEIVGIARCARHRIGVQSRAVSRCEQTTPCIIVTSGVKPSPLRVTGSSEPWEGFATGGEARESLASPTRPSHTQNFRQAFGLKDHSLQPSPPHFHLRFLGRKQGRPSQGSSLGVRVPLTGN